jgi:hypothetical protein
MKLSSALTLFVIGMAIGYAAAKAWAETGPP